jgi:hypothetical protein
MKRQLKFKFGKFENKPVIFEQDEITAHRQKYLLFIKKYRRQGYQVYLGLSGTLIIGLKHIF